MQEPLPQLTEEEKATYEWQMWVPDFGEAGQRRLRGSRVLISRAGGLGSVVAYELAAAGIGALTLAHAGDIKHSDLNRQLLMTHDALGTSRVESAKKRLLDLNPRLDISAIPENVSPENAEPYWKTSTWWWTPHRFLKSASPSTTPPSPKASRWWTAPCTKCRAPSPP